MFEPSTDSCYFRCGRMLAHAVYADLHEAQDERAHADIESQSDVQHEAASSEPPFARLNWRSRPSMSDAGMPEVKICSLCSR